MHDLNFREMTKELLAEESFIDLAYAILDEKKSAINFNDLVKEIQTLCGLSDEEMKLRLVQFYTDLNVDGRFLLNNESGWGLRTWYKVETIEEETAPTVKSRKKKSKAVVDDEELDIIDLDEEDLEFEEDFDEFVEEEEDDDDEVVEEEEDLDFVAEEIEDIDDDIEEDIIVEDEEFDLVEEDVEEEEEEFFEEDEK